MGRSFVFTPQTLQAIRRQAMSGKCAATIADILGAERRTIENICEKHGIPLPPIDGPAGHAPIRFTIRRRKSIVVVPTPIDRDAVAVLDREAEIRKVTAPTLMAMICEAVVESGIFSAVLDDE